MVLNNFNSNSNLKSKAKGLLVSTFLILNLANAETLDSNLSQIARADNINPISKENSVFVVSDEELKTYSSTAELIRELKVVRKDKETLLEYSKKLRDKFKQLEGYCAKDQPLARGIDSVNSCENSAELVAQVDNLKSDLGKKTQEIQNIKTEYEALKIKFSKVSEDHAKLSSSTKDSGTNIAKLDSELKQKTSESKACFEQLDKSQKLVVQIPTMEKEILGLKNELLMRKSAAELLGSSGHLKASAANDKLTKSLKTAEPEVKLNEEVSKVPVAKRVVPVNLESDVMIVEVIGDKVTLRAGPGQNNSSIMDLAKGARLTVEAREGNWFRVNSPTGGRAYINSGYVRVVDNGTGVVAKKVSRTQSFQDNELIGLDVEPVKPPLPKKPVKMNHAKKKQSLESEANDPISPTEALALRELKKAMKANSKK